MSNAAYDVRYKQFIGNSNNTNINTSYNIQFIISDAFIGPPPETVYFNLFSVQKTVVSFYQSNIKLVDSSYVLLIDKYECPGVDYNLIMNDVSLNELFFIASRHYTSSFSVDGKELPIGYQILNINDIFENISQQDIVFVKDETFDSTNIGITLSALSNEGIMNLQNLVRFNLESNLLSKVSYINMPDIINITSLFGSNIFRVTNSGNVRAPTVASYTYNLIDSTPFYHSSVGIMNNNTITNSGYLNSETIISTMPNCP
jgi:hypothetical protein